MSLLFSFSTDGKLDLAYKLFYARKMFVLPNYFITKFLTYLFIYQGGMKLEELILKWVFADLSSLRELD